MKEGRECPGPGLLKPAALLFALREHFLHRVPVIVAPALLDVVVVFFRHAHLGEGQPGAAVVFTQNEGSRGIVAFGPVAAPPGLDDSLILEQDPDLPRQYTQRTR